MAPALSSVRPRLELLESRLLLSGFEPTEAAQQFLEQLNDARANPAAYGESIGLDLSNVAPSQPLAFDPRLIEAAQLHSQDMHDRQYFAHDTPEGIDPGTRILDAGFPQTSYEESIAAGYSTTASALAGLIIDTGVPNLGHRVQLLALDSLSQSMQLVGIGVVQDNTIGSLGFLNDFYTIDEATQATSSLYLTGVVFHDQNGDGQYAPGEEITNVTITVAGVGSITDWDSGGYTFPLSPGTYTVTASGGTLAAPITQTVTLTSQNVRLNFVAPALQTTVGSLNLQPGEAIDVVGADAGSTPTVSIFDPTTHQLIYSFTPYSPNFTGGVRVAVGDVNGDGIPDIITATGPGGGPQINVYNGANGSLLNTFFAYDPNFIDGVFVAAGDVNGDGHADIICGTDGGGGPNVTVFSGADGSRLLSFFAYNPAFSGGVRVAAGDVLGNGRDDIICGAGPGGGPNVTVFDGISGQPVQSFFAYDPNFILGIYVAAGDVQGSGKEAVITGAGPGGGPNVTVFDVSGPTVQIISNFFPYDPQFVGGVRVAAVLRSGNQASILTVAGAGGGPDVATVDGLTGAIIDHFFAFPPTFSFGLYVAATAQ
jgi:uncharacterized protein YkwD